MNETTPPLQLASFRSRSAYLRCPEKRKVAHLLSVFSVFPSLSANSANSSVQTSLFLLPSPLSLIPRSLPPSLPPPPLPAMPHWPSTAIATRLIKYVTKIDLGFNPYVVNAKNPKHARGIREFMVRQMCERVEKSNPKLKMKVDVHNRSWLPEHTGNYVHITYVDGTTVKFDEFEGQVLELEEGMFMRAAVVEDEMEAAGKSID